MEQGTKEKLLQHILGNCKKTKRKYKVGRDNKLRKKTIQENCYYIFWLHD